MSITIKDVLKLPCMINAEVVAGKGGLDNIVTGVSVLEYSEPPQASEKMFFDREYLGSEIVITTFASVGDDIDKQYAEIQNLSATGAVGLVLYYMALFVKKLDKRIIRIANELGFVIICMPPAHYHLRYSETIACIQNAILLDRMKTKNFVPEIFDVLSVLPQSQQNMDTFLRIISDYLQLTLILTDQSWHLLSYAAWPTMLEREVCILIDEVLDSHANSLPKSDKKFKHYILQIRRSPKVQRNLIVVSRRGPVTDHSLNLIVNAIESFWAVSDESDDRRRGAQDLIHSVIGDEPIRMRKQAQFLGIDEKNLHNLLLFRQTFRKVENEHIIIDTIRKELHRNCRDYVVDVYSGDIVTLLNDDIERRLMVTLKEIKYNLSQNNIKGWLLYACNLKTTKEIRDAYYACVDTINAALRIYPCSEILSLHEILFAKSCQEIIDKGEAYIQEKTRILHILADSNGNLENELNETLSVFYFDAHMKTSQTAKLMYVHHNTVKYRLKKASQKLGNGITNMPEMQELYVALALKRLLGD